MESNKHTYLNECRLRGRVGNLIRRNFGMTEFALCTEATYSNPDGMIVVKCTWHTVRTFAPVEELKTGDWVEAVGAIDALRYADSAGKYQQMNIIKASSVTRL